MLLQPSLHQSKLSISSTISYSSSFPWRTPNFTPRRALDRSTFPITCSISQVHSYGTVDFERRPLINWNGVYRRISLMENPDLGAGTVLALCEKEGKKLTKWELCRVVKELRKYKRFKQALEVYDWMGSKGDKFRRSASDAAIQVDLIAKVHGVSAAEEYFQGVPDTLKDRRIYGALLNAYVKHKEKEKAEMLIDKMRDKNYATHALPFNVMMTLYMNLKEYDKVDKLIFEMTKKNIQLDMYSYNIWLSSRGSEGAVEKMEQAFEQMKLDRHVTANWTTYSTMATMYLKMGLNEKAEDCLKKVEGRITGRDRMPYHYLLSLYGNVGKKSEVIRVWNTYKSNFPNIPNLGYHAVISSLVRLGDIEAAENMYDEWMQIKTSYDPRIANLLMGSYVKDGNFDRAESLFHDITEARAKPNSNSWEILAEGHVAEKRVSEALSCLKEALDFDSSKRWKPKPAIVSSFFKLCEEEGDLVSKDVLENLFRQLGFLEDKNYASLIGLSISGNEKESNKRDSSSDGNYYESNEDAEDSEVLLN
ncbi:unnamed protein product [Linum tenue]|uniref:Pentatricopeptide repeat-containing protein n=1 Tax=Linum tenue TaxID=586396 RepID=A0AAV0QW23_9ROSI|nr:unnamed protein product [Linum tenue]